MYHKRRTGYVWWKARVQRDLCHPDALQCVAGEVEETLTAFWAEGFAPAQIAARLNERYRDGYLARKCAMTGDKHG